MKPNQFWGGDRHDWTQLWRPPIVDTVAQLRHAADLRTQWVIARRVIKLGSEYQRFLRHTLKFKHTPSTQSLQDRITNVLRQWHEVRAECVRVYREGLLPTVDDSGEIAILEGQRALYQLRVKALNARIDEITQEITRLKESK